MEVLQCDSCDFRAESYEELKSHIQEVHTAFLQPADAESDSVKEEEEEEEEEEQQQQEEEEEEEKHEDKDDTDYAPPKSGPSPTTDAPNHKSPKQTAESLLPFFQCKFCVRYFRSKSFLTNHTKKVHNVTEDDSDDSSLSSEASQQPSDANATHNEHPKVFSCHYCSYTTPRKARLIKHTVMYHNKEANSSEPAEPSEKGLFTCEWCPYQSDRRDSWSSHVVKEHGDKARAAEELEDEEVGVSPVHSSGRSPNTSSQEETLGQASETDLEKKPVAEISSFHYAQISAATPNSTGASILSKNFTSSDLSKNVSEMDHEEESCSSMEDEEDEDDDDDDELGDTDTPSYTGTLSADMKLLLSEEDSKLMETKGVPFRKYMNRFQCPFCSFLTMHRRSISRHIENIHLSGKATVYKCDECPFTSTSALKLGTHKQTHTSSQCEMFDLTGDSPDFENDSVPEPANGNNVVMKMNGATMTSTPTNQQNPFRCTLCSFSTTTLKGLRVHQQHKHSYCDDLDATVFDGQLNDQLEDSNSSPMLLQKAQTSILGLGTKKPLVAAKRARKSINDLPLDLSSVKKRTRIDEIASNLQSKISQSQQDLVINLDDLDDEDGMGNHSNANMDDRNHDGQNSVFAYSSQIDQDSPLAHDGARLGKRKNNPKLKHRSLPLSFTLSDDSENTSVNAGDTLQDSSDFSEESGNMRFYCKHCDYHNKSARSVSTHYQRMHPYIKFSFKYILDPEDQSAVFRCLECYIEYTNYNDLHQHYMDHHPEASNVLNFNQPDLVYMCRFCSYTSPNVRSLMPHYQRMHPTVKINNAMIFSSYYVEQPAKTGESQTLREILNSGPKSLSSAASSVRSSSSPHAKSGSKTPDNSTDLEVITEVGNGNVVVYDCDMCSFASPNMHSVLVHYQKKHPEHKASYFRIQKNMKVVSVEQGMGLHVSVASPSKPSVSAIASYGSDEEMFYCKHCVYSNRSVVGVLVHYQKRHPEVKVTAKYIKNGPPTQALMKLMDELQIAAPKQFLKQIQNSRQEESNPSPGNGDKDELFFCQHCDYGNRSVKGVLIHYQKKHKEAKASADLVRRHTAVVRSQREMVQSSSVSSAILAAPDCETGTPLRSLKCRHCLYTSPYVYALKKHLKKEHPTVKATAMTILHWAYQDGILEAGYHCEWCIYSHAEPQGLLVHYQKRHPEHNVDYAYMASKLWAGPETQTGSNAETKHYKCRDCAFEACTIWDITSHYQAIHPWVIKGDQSVLLDIIQGTESVDKSQASLPSDEPSFDCQPIEDDSPLVIATPPRETHSNSHSVHPRLSISTNSYQCTVCLSEYNSLHGLLTHYGKKHPGMKVKAADFAQEADINPSSVYKCRHCPYVNSRIHGVLTHYQKRHPLVKVTAEDFADDIEQITDVPEGDDKCKTQRQGFGAYRCKMCSYTHGTLEKLKIHYEKCHNQSVTDILTPSLTHFSSTDAERVAECSASNSAGVSLVQESGEVDFGVTRPPVNKTEKHAIFKCQLCKYFCSTRKGIARHYRIKHNNVRAQPEGKNNVFKCALCPYTNPIRKGLAAHYQKRHDIDAYYTHCLAASKTMTDKPVKVIATPPPEPDTNSEMTEEIRLAVEQRKCSLCAFQAFSRKSIVSHYIKRHPGVFPKKQQTSKLGRYFTIIYAKDEQSENSGMQEVVEEEEKVTAAVEMPLQDDNDDDMLPFKCTKCFRLSFNCGEMLSMHYNDHHGEDLKRDFGVMPGPEEEVDEEVYKCSHCELSYQSLETLAKHLMGHNEEFEKRALRQERRKILLSKVKTPDGKEEKQETPDDTTPIGYRCNFCTEVHTTLRAICNHLRKHVQYGEAKEGQVKQEATEVPLTPASETLTNGDVEVLGSNGLQGLDLTRPDADQTEPEPEEELQAATGAAVAAVAAVAGGKAAALVAAARAMACGTVGKRQADGVGHACAQCERVFMSMQGLRSHERSHTAMAAFSKEDKYNCQYCQFASPFRHNLDRHIQSHHGHHKPFKCKLCPFKSAYMNRLKSHMHKAHTGETHMYRCVSCAFSSPTISQLKEHSQRDHGETLTLPKLRAATQAAHLKPRQSSHSEQGPLSLSDDPSYLEPVDVRQQLSQYQLAARSQMGGSSSSLGVSAVSDHRPEGVYTCEYCEFSSGYIQSVRRHYRDRHGGQKLFKCKDCHFFTCSKDTLAKHAEAGHSSNSNSISGNSISSSNSLSVPAETLRDLRCPLCLYHTKSKSNMIDHIVLHREERVAPLEVSRSKLSRHLQGLVFRCHQCTFTSSSDQSLQSHLLKHRAQVKPYQCQLCYYDSGRKSQLEEHLRLQHKVIRNFELMGRVNLDRLEMVKDPSSSSAEEEEEHEETQEQEEQEAGPVAEDDVMEDTEAGEEARDQEEPMELNSHEEERREPEETKETTEEMSTVPEVLSSPTVGGGVGLSGGEESKRLPCEFCGRCFTNSSEWERHVQRHGMVIHSPPTDTSATEASSSQASVLESGLDQDQDQDQDLRTEPQTQSQTQIQTETQIQTQSPSRREEEEDDSDTKKDPQLV